MDLLTFRKFFRQNSGRFDLITSDGKDTGADVFINQAVKYLDRRVDVQQALGEQEIVLQTGQVSVDIEVSSVHKVWVKNTSDDARTELQRLDINEARRFYKSDATFEGVDNGAPLYYVVGIPRTPALSPVRETQRRLLILPPTDESITLIVSGGLIHRKLVEDGDSNFWTLEEPLLLAMTTAMLLEMPWRNTAGLSDLKNSVDMLIQNLEFETVEQEHGHSDHLRNSWRYQDDFQS